MPAWRFTKNSMASQIWKPRVTSPERTAVLYWNTLNL